jgi:hypothetical protein
VNYLSLRTFFEFQDISCIPILQQYMFNLFATA